MAAAYDEDRELRRYIPAYCGELLSDSERRTLRDVMYARKIHMSDPEGEIRPVLRRMMRDPSLADLDDHALDELETALCRRALERGGDGVVHRCGRCVSVLRTPLARQCLRCGYDWHAADPA